MDYFSNEIVNEIIFKIEDLKTWTNYYYRSQMSGHTLVDGQHLGSTGSHVEGVQGDDNYLFRPVSLALKGIKRI